jgi:hypothetical protein
VDVGVAVRTCVLLLLVVGKNGYKSPVLLHLAITLRVCRSFTERPKGSNSIEQLLSVVNRRTEIKFLIMLGDTRTLFRTRGECGVGNEYEPVEVIGKRAPLPTIIEEGSDEEGEREDERIPE